MSLDTTTLVRQRRRRAVVRSAAGAILCAVVILGGWQLAITLSGASGYITKSPLDVIAYLFVDGAFGGTAAEHRAEVAGLVAVTIGHAAIGLVVGVSAGVIGAVLLAFSSTLRTMFMPIAIFLQTVPLIALAPVIYAVFGSGVLTVAVIAGVVTFFPLLVNLMAGFGATAPEVRDVVTVYGGGPVTMLMKVSLPSSLPYLFAGLRLAVPATIGAAMLYEFLFTFEGLGAAMSTSRQFSNYALMWTVVVVSVVLALAAYAAVIAVERLVLRGRVAPDEADA